MDLRDDALTGHDLGVLDTARQVEAQQVRVQAGRSTDAVRLDVDICQRDVLRLHQLPDVQREVEHGVDRGGDCDAACQCGH